MTSIPGSVAAATAQQELGGTPAPSGSKRKTAPNSYSMRRINYWPFLIPAVVAVAVIIVGPLIYTLYLSLRNFDLTRGINTFVGFDNYAEILSGDDPAFVQSLFRTLLYVVLVVGFDFLIGMTQALILFSMPPRIAKIWRIVFMLPILIIPTAAAVFWRAIMYAPPNEQFLKTLGLDGIIEPPLGNPDLAFTAIVITVIWAWSPWVFLLLSGGLDAIDKTLLEAATVDGANYFQRLRGIILPLMMPVIFVTLSFKAVDSFLSFPFIWVMTQGGPGGSTHLLSTYIYEQAFKFLNYGYGSALAIVMLVISSVLSIAAVLYWQRTQVKEFNNA
jgi:multiple sugar transport system permease protein